MAKQSGVVCLVSALALLSAVSSLHATPTSFLERSITTPEAEKLREKSAYDQALDALDRKQLQQAENLFKKALDENPNSAPALLGLAEVARLRKQDAEAERLVRRAVQVAPANGESQLALGRLLFAQRKFKEAEPYFLKAADALPSSTAPVLALGELYLNILRAPDKAVGAFKKATQLNPRHAGARYGLGMSYMALKDFNNAIENLGEATRLAGDNAFAFIGLSQAYAGKKETKPAIQAAQHAVALQPRYVPAQLNLADIASVVGQYDIAVAALSDAEKIDPNSAAVQLKLGAAFQQTSQWERALSAYERAATLDPKQGIAYNNMAWIAAEQKIRLVEAENWAKKALVISPKDPSFRDTYGWLKRAQGDLKGALEQLEQATSGDRPGPEALYHLGIVRSELGLDVEAIAAFRKTLQIYPDLPQARDVRNRIKELESKKSR